LPVRVVEARVAPVRPGIGRDEQRRRERSELDRAREGEDDREPRAATHRPEAYEITGEGGREQRDEDRTELVVPMRPAAVDGDERRLREPRANNARDDEREGQRAGDDRGATTDQGA
jgi:hypothetical protein